MPRAPQTVSVGCDGRTTKSWLTASAVAASLPLLALYAPHRALAAAAEAGEELQEVVVTAEKRSSTVQETPISLSALSSDDLQNRNITSVEDLAAQVPGVSMRTAGPGPHASARLPSGRKRTLLGPAP